MNATVPNQPTTFDEAALLQSVDGDFALLREIVRIFSENDNPRLISLLKHGLEQRHAQTIIEAGHALKGLFGEMRAFHAQSLARCVERAGQTGDFTGLDTLILELIAESENLTSELRRYLTAHTS